LCQPEFRCAAQRRQDGIVIDDTIWETICEEARAFGLDPK